MSLFPRFVAHDFPRIVNSDFAPVWRLLDDYANQVVSARHADAPATSQLSRFNPRFDVQEVEGAYELKGELPGIEQKDVEIEFPDQQTIVIKGQTGYSREEQTSTEEPKPSQQPTVEDEPEVSGGNSDAATEASSAEGTPVPTPAASEAGQVQSTEVQSPAKSRYWVSERYTGSFQRTFSFPAPVDTENAKAKLRNGVLEVTIPKVQKAGVKRINIE